MFREIICNKKNTIFILPYVALVQEKVYFKVTYQKKHVCVTIYVRFSILLIEFINLQVQSMAILALKLGFLVEEYAGTKGHYPPIKRRRKNSIYICTIEKAVGLVNSLIETKRLAEVS